MKKKSNLTYKYWRENIMDERLEYLSADEKYELYLHWYNEEKNQKNVQVL